MAGNTPPRVFISYARSDGEAFATQLRQEPEAKGIPLWQDRVGMEGGRDWWLQNTGGPQSCSIYGPGDDPGGTALSDCEEGVALCAATRCVCVSC